jgi:CRP-like cAMP-binding protein
VSLDVLALTEGLPTRALEAGEALFTDTTSVVVLVSGSLRAEVGTTVLSVMEQPGTFVGEVGALLGLPRSASVTAQAPTVVRVIGEPEAFFTGHPELGLELARQLAGRLHRLTAYLADVREQYAGSDGHLAMVDRVLGRIASRPPVTFVPGSRRAPDL